MDSRLDYKPCGEITVETDCAVMFHKHRTRDGFIRGELFDEKNNSQGLFQTKFLRTPGLAACMAVYIVTSDNQIFLLHISLPQAKDNMNSYFEPYFHLKDRVKGSIVKVKVYGHIENFDEVIFREALKSYQINLHEHFNIQLIKPPAEDGLFNGEFNFFRYQASIEVDDSYAIFGRKRKIQPITAADFSVSPVKTAPLDKSPEICNAQINDQKEALRPIRLTSENEPDDKPSLIKSFILILSVNKWKILQALLIGLLVALAIFSAGAIPAAIAGLSTALVVSAGFTKIVAIASPLSYIAGTTLLAASLGSPWWIPYSLKKILQGIKYLFKPSDSNDTTDANSKSEVVNPYRALPKNMIGQSSPYPQPARIPPPPNSDHTEKLSRRRHKRSLSEADASNVHHPKI